MLKTVLKSVAIVSTAHIALTLTCITTSSLPSISPLPPATSVHDDTTSLTSSPRSPFSQDHGHLPPNLAGNLAGNQHGDSPDNLVIVSEQAIRVTLISDNPLITH